MIKPIKHSHLPAEAFQFSALGYDRSCDADQRVAPLWTILDFVRRPCKAEARAGDVRLGSAVVEPLQRLVQGDELPRLVWRHGDLHVGPISGLDGRLLIGGYFIRFSRRLDRHLMGCCGDAEHLLVWPAQRWKAAHDERRQAVGPYGELQPDQRKP